MCKQLEHFFCVVRTLDAELRSHIRGNDPMFEITKLAFFAEATGEVQEYHILEAQNNVANARKTSLQAGFALFKTSLSNDQVLHDRFLAASKTDEARARSAALGSLEAVVWFLLSLDNSGSMLPRELQNIKTVCSSDFLTLAENAYNCMGLGAELCHRKPSNLECCPEERLGNLCFLSCSILYNSD